MMPGQPPPATVRTNEALPAPSLPSLLPYPVHHARDRRGHQRGERAAEDGAQAEARDVLRRPGARPPIPPIWMAIDEKFANPQRA